MTRSGETPAEMAARFVAWLASPEGQVAMRVAELRIEETHKAFAKMHEISWEDLNAPFTI